MTKDERERVERIEKQIADHLKEVPAILSNHESERRDMLDRINTLFDRLFGNGTKRGSIDDRLTIAERAIESIKENQWTKKDQRVFEEDLKKEMEQNTAELIRKVDGLKKQLRLPWIILTNLVLAAGALAAVITFFIHMGSHAVH